LNREKSYELIYKKNIRNFIYYNEINILIKLFLNYLSNVEYLLAGNFVDLRDGLIYLSFVGMVANEEERQNFINLDIKKNYRLELLEILQKKAIELNIDKYVDILLGGSVGIAIYPTEWNKVQIINDGIIDKNYYNNIYYFGDKYNEDGNDYKLLNHNDIIYPTCDRIECYRMLLLLNTHKKQNKRYIDYLCHECLINYELCRSKIAIQRKLASLKIK
jgi:hypothetical protein